jgi:glycosyltransferase involved in cell wall biosynthesis
MKICLVGMDNLPVLAPDYKDHSIGGESVQQSLLGRVLVRNGHKVTMVVGDYGQPDGADYRGIMTHKAYKAGAGIPILRFIHPRWTGLWTALKRADADVYYTSCAGMGLGLMAMFCRRHNRRLVFRLAHDFDAEPEKLLIRFWRDKKLYEYGLRRADVLIAQTESQQRALHENYGLSSSITAGMFVDPPAKHLDFIERDVDVLWVNNIRAFKRPDLAISLASQLPSRQIHIIGGRLKGFESMYDDLERASASLANVTFHGRIAYHDIGDFYDRSRVFVNTSDSEGFPNSYLQCWRRGVPVIAFFDPDGLIRREGLGKTVDTVEEMASAVERFLTDKDYLRETSARCADYMKRQYDDDIVVGPYLQAFREAEQRTATA